MKMAMGVLALVALLATVGPASVKGNEMRAAESTHRKLSRAHIVPGSNTTNRRALLQNVAPDGGACGQSAGATCPDGECCSQYDYCGVTDGHCGDGCQPGYGACASAPGGENSAATQPPTEPQSGCRPQSAAVSQGSYTSIVLSASQDWRWNCAGQSRYPGAQILMWWDWAVAEWEQFFIFNLGRLAGIDDIDLFQINTVMATCAWWECLLLTFHHNPIVIQDDGLQLGQRTDDQGDAFKITCDACSSLQAGHYAQGCIIQAGERCVNKAYSAGLVLGSCDGADKWDFWA